MKLNPSPQAKLRGDAVARIHSWAALDGQTTPGSGACLLTFIRRRIACDWHVAISALGGARDSARAPRGHC